MVSFVAVLFSTFVFRYDRRTSRRDLLLDTHERQLLVENQHGRAVLFEAQASGTPAGDLSAADFRSANHALRRSTCSDSSAAGGMSRRGTLSRCGG
ncbi:hypothetical protein [Amycolatopsis sp. NPDC049159]|uniref:hypothetical protein n=1 Tax=Amycolatopsis sp. NPDC049159 TaxID=3157210 RepID=UPI0033FE621E